MTKEERVERLIKDFYWGPIIICITRGDFKNRLLREFKGVWDEGYVAGHGDAVMEQ